MKNVSITKKYTQLLLNDNFNETTIGTYTAAGLLYIECRRYIREPANPRYCSCTLHTTQDSRE